MARKDNKLSEAKEWADCSQFDNERYQNIRYASEYSRKVWDELMRRHREHPGYWIGANDVSDIVMNAILYALDGKSMPEDFSNI